ncbi:ComEB Deoxycytidylate deaminase [uncultured Caudovirales phage]|jgi:dCMP deaminase|uniref:ComEB Deoxycytidylate deaminase n=1 Tax=uncultured Caudovirales phage TaxID=2100421 RepID=A0A6J5RHX1_9CAUD|nr:ComEB Deoxycytidylate deaminase [uncultured Caudovirales phage]CAB4193867.1 ComEB Deoxycytidylate deaminase [uncultured Caudovirales phage]
MTNKDIKYHLTYLKMAAEWSNLSCCKRKKVGALIVKDGTIISDGFNGTPKGFPNDCEDANDVTHWYVLHAEANAMLKVARSTQSTDGASLYVTYSPCRECSKLIIQAGIKLVVYREEYRDVSGIKILKEAGINIVKLDV